MSTLIAPTFPPTRRVTPITLRVTRYTQSLTRRPLPPSLPSPGVYARTGKVGDFAIKPHVMHFGGFEVGKVYTQRFVVTNTGRKSQRLQILEPTSQFFAVRWEGKGSLAPGMSETVRVDFCADDVRYFYDCVRIRAGGDKNAILPMHAYPTPNEAKFPKHVDFGLCALGSTSVKTVRLACKVPIAFEFELRLSSENKAFEVYPRSGEIPANGDVEITIKFTPRRQHTSTLDIEVFTGEFGGNTRPRVCNVRGIGFPSVARDKGVRALAGVSEGPVDAGRLADGTAGAQFAEYGSLGAMNDVAGAGRYHATGRFGPGGGAGGGDAYTEYVKRLASKHRQPPSGENTGAGRAGPRHRKLSSTLDRGGIRTSAYARDPSDVRAMELDEEEGMDGEDDVDGVFVPRRISGHGDVQYVLGQRKGKLRAKELREAVALRESQSKTVRASLAGLVGRVDPGDAADPDDGAGTLETSNSAAFNFKHAVRDVQRAQTSTKGAPNAVFKALDDPHLDPRVKELIFEKEFERVRQYERVKDVTNCVAIGGDVLDPGDEAIVRLRREGRAAALEYYETSAAMARVSAGHETTLGASYEVVAGTPVALTDVKEPEYNENANDTWRMRRETLDRFVQAGRKVIIRNRAEARLRGIRSLMATIGDKSRASAHVAKELMSGAGAGPSEDAEVLEPCKIGEDVVRDFSFPTLLESAFREWPSLAFTDKDRIGEFEEMTPLPLIEPPEWRLKGHSLTDDAAKPTPLHGDGIQPRLSDTPIYSGAEEESGPDAVAPRGVLHDVPLPRIPGVGHLSDTVSSRSVVTRVWPHESSAHDGVVTAWGEDLVAAVRPGTYGYLDSLTREPIGCNALAAMSSANAKGHVLRALSDEWVPRRSPWRGVAVKKPALMTGPAPEDLMTDEDGEGFGGTGEPVPPPGEMPTTESVRAKYHIPGVSKPGTNGEDGGEGEDAGGGGECEGEEAPAEPTPEPTPEEPAVEMERVRRMRDMDAELHSRREELLDKLRKRTEEYNALIVDPRLRWELV